MSLALRARLARQPEHPGRLLLGQLRVDLRAARVLVTGGLLKLVEREPAHPRELMPQRPLSANP